MGTLKTNSFAAACYDMNTIAELQQALADGPDTTDMENWGLTADEWTAQIKEALSAKMDDEA